MRRFSNFVAVILLDDCWGLQRTALALQEVLAAGCYAGHLLQGHKVSEAILLREVAAQSLQSDRVCGLRVLVMPCRQRTVCTAAVGAELRCEGHRKRASRLGIDKCEVYAICGSRIAIVVNQG